MLTRWLLVADQQTAQLQTAAAVARNACLCLCVRQRQTGRQAAPSCVGCQQAGRQEVAAPASPPRGSAADPMLPLSRRHLCELVRGLAHLTAGQHSMEEAAPHTQPTACLQSQQQQQPPFPSPACGLTLCVPPPPMLRCCVCVLVFRAHPHPQSLTAHPRSPHPATPHPSPSAPCCIALLLPLPPRPRHHLPLPLPTPSRRPPTNLPPLGEPPSSPLPSIQSNPGPHPPLTTTVLVPTPILYPRRPSCTLPLLLPPFAVGFAVVGPVRPAPSLTHPSTAPYPRARSLSLHPSLVPASPACVRAHVLACLHACMHAHSSWHLSPPRSHTHACIALACTPTLRTRTCTNTPKNTKKGYLADSQIELTFQTAFREGGTPDRPSVALYLSKHPNSHWQPLPGAVELSVSACCWA